MRHGHRDRVLVPRDRKRAVGLGHRGRKQARNVAVDRKLGDVHERLRVLSGEYARKVALVEAALDEHLAEPPARLDRLAQAFLDRFERQQSGTQHERPERDVVGRPAFRIRFDRVRSDRSLVFNHHHRS